MKENIISIKTFPWEYTAIQLSNAEVKRCNIVCADCWLKISEQTKRNLTGMATTCSKKECDLCWEKKYTCSIRHYL